ncbi:MAG: preprotein translocase subunit YajC [Bacteroidota bacterium]|nr:preprotein translocase subunit YajC [Bacteroidota bacterium]
MLAFINNIFMMSAPGGGSGGGGSIVPTLVMFGAIILIMYFLMIRPQQKRQKEHQKMLESVKRGDKVVTTAGMHGTVTDVDDKTIEIQVADNVKIRFEKSAVATKK